METPHLSAAIRAAHRAGEILAAFRGPSDDAEHIDAAAVEEAVAEVGLLAERRIVETLVAAFPGSSLWSATAGYVPGGASDVLWIVDPLDGTASWVNGIPFAAVSVACVVGGELHAGVVHNPFTRDFFYAQRGFGAWMNEGHITVARTPLLRQALLGCEFSPRATPGREREHEVFGRLNDASRGCLRTGSAALSLAYVAAGKLAGTWGRSLGIWDVAAGLLLVEEAGGRVASDVSLGQARTTTVSYLATNGPIHAQLCDVLAQVLFNARPTWGNPVEAPVHV